jgi:hypothetical protein
MLEKDSERFLDQKIEENGLNRRLAKEILKTALSVNTNERGTRFAWLCLKRYQLTDAFNAVISDEMANDTKKEFWAEYRPDGLVFETYSGNNRLDVDHMYRDGDYIDGRWLDAAKILRLAYRGRGTRWNRHHFRHMRKIAEKIGSKRRSSLESEING